MNISTVFKAARPPFLLLTPVCILFGYALAAQSSVDISLTDTLLILLGGLAAHCAVNWLNEYQDYHSGLDAMTVKTPFSGGSGALIEDPDSAKGVFIATIASLAIVVTVGLYFLLYGHGLQILLFGLGGIALIIAYTKYVNRHPWICLISPGLGFGIFMVLSTVILLAGALSIQAILLALVPFCQINNLLLLNQYPDIEADAKVGRNHFAITYGVGAATQAYAVMLFTPFALIAGLIAMQLLPLLAVIALLPLIPGVMAWQGARTLGAGIAAEPRYLAMNVMLTLVTPVLLAVSIL